MNSCKEEETRSAIQVSVLSNGLCFASGNKVEKAEAGISVIFTTSCFSSCFILELVLYNMEADI